VFWARGSQIQFLSSLLPSPSLCRLKSLYIKKIVLFGPKLGVLFNFQGRAAVEHFNAQQWSALTRSCSRAHWIGPLTTGYKSYLEYLGARQRSALERSCAQELRRRAPLFDLQHRLQKTAAFNLGYLQCSV